jgi:hypothetical protein
VQCTTNLLPRIIFSFYAFILCSKSQSGSTYCTLYRAQISGRQTPGLIRGSPSLLYNKCCFHNKIIYDFFSLSYNPDLVVEFIPKTWHIWDNWRIFFNFIFTLYPYWIFVKRDKFLSKKIKF